ncbi:MAG: glycosyltransferase [Bacilli bacterium]
MKKCPLFSVILLYYKQKEYISNALNSILKQEYSNIELIICDDGSDLDTKTINQSIIENKKITKHTYIINEKNLGTVKTVNKALKKANGEFVLIFAADDELYDKYVLQNYSKLFDKYKNKYVISSQCLLYNNTLTESYGEYVDKDVALKLNDEQPIEQYKALCTGCIFAAGSTAYRRKIFLETNYIPEKYKIIEDLSYWLFITQNNYQIFYCDFISLKHRDGGVSKQNHLENNTPKHVLDYYTDILHIKEEIVFNSLKLFELRKKKEIIDDYRNYINFYKKYFNEFKPLMLNNIFLKNPWYVCLLIYRKFKKIYNKIVKKITTTLNLKIIFWIFLNLFVIFNQKITNSYIYLFLYFLSTYLLSSLLFRLIKKTRSIK